MARVAFTFRREAPEAGSALQSPPEIFVDDSTALKGDDYGATRPEPPTPPSNRSPFSEGSSLTASVIDYTVVELKWTLGTNLATSITSTPQAVEISVRYSIQGEPRTVLDGGLLTRISPGQEKWDIIHEGLPQGRWVYYTLFVKYQSTTTAWYERVGSLKVMTPIDFGSTELFWEASPEQYRLQDGSDSGDLSISSPLFGMGPLLVGRSWRPPWYSR